MGLYLVRRLVGVGFVIVFVTAITWVTVHALVPGTFASDQRSAWTQFADYMLGAFLHFDLGISWDNQGRPVAELVRERVPQDVQLLIGGGLFGVLAGIGGGMFCAVRPRSLITRALETVAFFFLCSPVYVVGLALILLFGAGVGTLFDVGWLMPAKYIEFNQDPLRWLGSMLAPWIVLGLPLAALCLRMTSAVMRETFDEPYMRTAEMKGVAPRTIVRRHALPASAAPVLSLTGVSVPVLITNTVLVESVFSVPGVFQNTPEAMNDGNFPLLQAMVMVGAALVALTSLVFDVALAALDPRVRLSEPR
jgi:peptide/nickel transport system permease protein